MSNPGFMNSVLKLATIGASLLLAACSPPPTDPNSQAAMRDDRVTAMTAIALRDAMSTGQLSATQVTGAFLERIERLDPTLNAILEVNPDAMKIAGELDQRRAGGEKPGLLFGVPVVLKANIDTADAMATSAGSMALADHHATEDAFLVGRLRQAGAVIIAKANMSEWANFRSRHSTSGWSSLGGQTVNAYRPERNPCGSSSGSAVAVAARLAPLAVGTETDGSIVCPAGANGIVGLKPTMGRISRHGIIPIAASQDTAGPMARNAADAALLMRVMDGYDPRDRTTRTMGKKYPIIPPTPQASVSNFRIGVWRDYHGAGKYPQITQMLDAKVAQLRALGFEVVDPITMSVGAVGQLSQQVLLHEFKDGINRYLAGTELPPARRSLAGIIEFNDQHAAEVMPHFGQDLFVSAQASGDLTNPEYQNALQQARQQANVQLAGALQRHGVEVIISITNGPAWTTDPANGDRFEVGSSTLPAVSGHPHLTAPMGMIDGLPVGLSMFTHRTSEHRVLQLAFMLEDATGPFPEPPVASDPAP